VEPLDYCARPDKHLMLIVVEFAFVRNRAPTVENARGGYAFELRASYVSKFGISAESEDRLAHWGFDLSATLLIQLERIVTYDEEMVIPHCVPPD
jgi:hypothetical protein